MILYNVYFYCLNWKYVFTFVYNMGSWQNSIALVVKMCWYFNVFSLLLVILQKTGPNVMLSKKNLQLSWHLTPVCVFLLLLIIMKRYLLFHFMLSRTKLNYSYNVWKYNIFQRQTFMKDKIHVSLQITKFFIKLRSFIQTFDLKFDKK